MKLTEEELRVWASSVRIQAEIARRQKLLEQLGIEDLMADSKTGWLESIWRRLCGKARATERE